MNAPQSETLASAGTIVNPGEILRSARESHGVSLAVVSLQLNIPERILQQIEAGDFSHLPGHTFARGYVRAYAKLMELDQSRLVQEFDRYTGTNATGSQVHSLSNIEEPARLSSIGLRLFTFVLLLILVGSAFFLWQEGRLTGKAGPTPSVLGRIEVEGADGKTQIHSLDEPEEPVVAAAAPVQVTPSVAPAPATNEPQTHTEPSIAPTTPPTSTTSPPLNNVAPAETANSSAVEQVSSPAAGEARLDLVFTADCWLRIVDADGRVLLNALVRSGQSRTLQGRPPLNLRIGFARGVQLTFNGEPVDLKPYTRGETASLKLGQ